MLYNHASVGSTNDVFAPGVTVTSPAAGASLSISSNVNVQWSASDNVGVVAVHLHYSTNSGSSWVLIATNQANSGTFVWTVPNLGTNAGQIRVTAQDAANNAGVGFSGGFVTADLTPPSVVIVAPTNGATLSGGTTTNILWTATDNVAIANVDLEYSLNNGASWSELATGLSNSGMYAWSVPNIATTVLKVRATVRDSAGLSSSATTQPLTIVRVSAPPVQPNSPFPLNTGAAVSVTPTLQWRSGSLDGGALSFTVRFGTAQNPPVVGTASQMSFSPGALNYLTTYYWQVEATDGVSTNPGPVWSFTTEAITPVSITTQPTNVTALVTSNAAFSVTAIGTGPLAYQWFFNSTNALAGATNTSLTLTNAQPTNAGNYTVVVTNAAGSVTSAVAVLMVLVPPTVTAGPTNLTVNALTDATFSVTAGGTLPLTYQWWKGGVLLGNANGASLTLNAVTTNSAGAYQVVVTNVAGSVTSSVAVLTVNRLVPGLTWATPSAITYGTALGAGQLNATNAVSGNLTYSPTGGVLPVGPRTLNVVFTPADGSVYTTNAASVTLTVNPAPLTIKADNQSRPFGQTNPVLTVSYTGFVNGETSGVLTSQPVAATTATTASAPGNYPITVSGASAANYAVTQTSGILTVTGDAPAITVQPTDAVVIAGSNVAFSVTATGIGPLAFQWLFNATNALAGATNTTLTLTNALLTSAGNYTVMVTNVVGSVTSAVAVLTVLVPPSITAQPVSQTVSVGQSVSFTVTATGTAPLNYQWRKDGTNLNGATSATYNLAGVQTNQAGSYTVVVSNAAGSITSTPPAVLSVNEASAGTVLAWGYNGAGQTTVPAGLSGVTAIAAGYSHTVALKSDGTMVAWGDNSAGATAVPTGLSGVTAIAAGDRHTVALKNDGTVVAWGLNSAGQATVPAGLSGVTAIACGGYHTVALKSDGTVVAWGSGATNTGTFPEFGQSIVPAGLNGVMAIAGGFVHTLAVKGDGTVVAWGAGKSSTGTFPEFGQSIVPPGLSAVMAIVASYYHSVALKNDGTVVAWGGNDFGQATVPAGLSGVTAIAVGYYHSVALKSDGTVVAWGNTGYGQTTVPAGLSGVTAIAAGQVHTVAVGVAPPSVTRQPQNLVAGTNSNAIFNVVTIGTAPLNYVWRKDGVNLAGATNAYLTLSNVQTNQAGNYSVVITNTYGSVTSSVAVLVVNPAPPGTVVTWGDDGYGQTAGPFAFSGVTAIAAGDYNTVALKNDGTVVAWGAGTNDTVAYPNYRQSIVPPGLNGVMAIAAGASHTAALRSDGTVVTWGYDYYGYMSVPAGLSGVTAIAAGGAHTVALKSDGTVVAWGDNRYGQTNVPAGLTGVRAIAAGGIHTVALKSDGTVVAWGDNQYGLTNTPAGLSGVTAIACGFLHTVALKNDGTVVVWGWNGYGQTNVPVGLSGVTAIAGGGYHTVALKNDGTVVAWGDNSAGQTTVIVGLSGVTAIAAGRQHTVALIGIAPTNAPTIVTQPVSQTANAGQNASFAVTVSGTAPLSYQWRKNTVNISGANGPSFSLYSVTTSDAGSYDVVVTNIVGSATSSAATLTVVPVNYSLTLSASPSDGGTVSGGGTFAGGSSQTVTATANSGYVFANWLEGGVSVSSSASYTFALNGNRTLVANFTALPPVNDSFANRIGLVAPNLTVTGTNTNATKEAGEPNHNTNPGGKSLWWTWTAPSSGTVTVDTIGSSFDTVLAVYTGTAASALTLVASDDDGGGNLTSRLTFTATMGTTYQIAVDGYNGRSGSIRLTITPSGVAPPTITMPPASVNALRGTSPTLTVIASGTSPLFYQWFRNGVPVNSFVDGGTNASLLLFDLQPNEGGNFTVLVSNAFGSVMSAPPATVTVLVPPAITTQPVSQTAVGGMTVVFNVSASGQPAPAYQWFINATNALGGATNTSLTLTNTQLTNAGNYTVVVTNSAGSVTSAVAVLTVSAVDNSAIVPAIGNFPVGSSNAVYNHHLLRSRTVFATLLENVPGAGQFIRNSQTYILSNTVPTNILVEIQQIGQATAQLATYVSVANRANTFELQLAVTDTAGAGRLKTMMPFNLLENLNLHFWYLPSYLSAAEIPVNLVRAGGENYAPEILTFSDYPDMTNVVIYFKDSNGAVTNQPEIPKNFDFGFWYIPPYNSFAAFEIKGQKYVVSETVIPVTKLYIPLKTVTNGYHGEIIITRTNANGAFVERYRLEDGSRIVAPTSMSLGITSSIPTLLISGEPTTRVWLQYSTNTSGIPVWITTTNLILSPGGSGMHLGQPVDGIRKRLYRLKVE
ncbi:MAG: immunoglobulin domain-containing protein [Limisphaerales bacterium]